MPPGLQLCSHAAASRWRGPLGQADVLPLQVGQPHHHQLQVLRRVLDLQPDGRWGRGLTAGLARHPASQRHPALLRRLFLWLDGRRVDAQLARCFPGALADLALDTASPLPAWLATRLPGASPATPATPATPADALAAWQLARQWHQLLLAGRTAHWARPRSSRGQWPAAADPARRRRGRWQCRPPWRWRYTG